MLAATRRYGNPSSLHQEGKTARGELERSRRRIAGVIAAHPDEVVFTSGGTEGNNLAVFGVVQHLMLNKTLNKIRRPHLVVSSIEHPSVLEPCRLLEKNGCRATYLPVTAEGLVDPAEVKKALRSDTVLVSVAYANNEIGVIQPIREIGKIIRQFKKAQSPKLEAKNYPHFHTDACQAPRFLDLDVARLGIDLLTVNGSKIYGPRGSGFLYIRRSAAAERRPLLAGGGQEAGRRSGTENLPAVVGLAESLEICRQERDKETRRLTRLRDYFISKLLKISGCRLNGSVRWRLPNNINVSFSGMEAEQLVIELDARGVAASAGSACAAQTKNESYVILALGKTAAEARSSIRFTLGRETARREIDYVLRILPPILQKLRLGFSLTKK